MKNEFGQWEKLACKSDTAVCQFDKYYHSGFQRLPLHTAHSAFHKSMHSPILSSRATLTGASRCATKTSSATAAKCEVRIPKCEVRIKNGVEFDILRSTFVLRSSRLHLRRARGTFPAHLQGSLPRGRGHRIAEAFFCNLFNLVTHLTRPAHGQLPCCTPPPLSIACARFRA